MHSLTTSIVGTLLAASAVITAPLESRDSTWTPAQGGCWTDSVEDRALQQSMGVYDDLTPPKCQLLCQDAGFPLAGVESGRECFCGKAITGFNLPALDESCNMPCTGDNTQICGGTDTIYIYVKDNFPYTVGPPSPLSNYNGYSKTSCWRDSPSDRILKHEPDSPIPGDQMTVQKCIDGCAAAGYSSAGVELGRECYCDNHDWFFGYIANSTTIGIATPVMDVSWAERFTFEVPEGAASVTQAEITSYKTIDGFPFLGLIQGGANVDSDIAPGSYQYLYLGGTSHSAPGAIPQTGPNGYANNSVTWESSVWNINITTGDLTPQWINSDGSSPATYLIRHQGAFFFGTGDPDAFNSHFGEFDPTVKLRFNPNL
ncbi:hypothetical protein FRB91_012038 [Serendipita sp. 411]|nr:hypothetical protein FRB91_012038 [Serendipita sp. 411]